MWVFLAAGVGESGFQEEMKSERDSESQSQSGCQGMGGADGAASQAMTTRRGRLRNRSAVPRGEVHVPDRRG